MDQSAVIQLLVGIHKDQTAIANALWVVYQTVTLALIGYAVSQEHVRRSAAQLTALSLGYVLFASANQQAIVRAQKLIVGSAQGLKEIGGSIRIDSPVLATMLDSYQTVDPGTVRLFHSALCVVVLFAMWGMHVAQRKKIANAS